MDKGLFEYFDEPTMNRCLHVEHLESSSKDKLISVLQE